MIIKVTRMTGETAPADSSGDQGMGGGIANINLAPVATGGVNGRGADYRFQQGQPQHGVRTAGVGSWRPPLPRRARAQADR